MEQKHIDGYRKMVQELIERFRSTNHGSFCLLLWPYGDIKGVTEIDTYPAHESQWSFCMRTTGTEKEQDNRFKADRALVDELLSSAGSE